MLEQVSTFVKAHKGTIIKASAAVAGLILGAAVAALVIRNENSMWGEDDENATMLDLEENEVSESEVEEE